MASFCVDENEIYEEEETPVLSVPEGGEGMSLIARCIFVV